MSESSNIPLSQTRQFARIANTEIPNPTFFNGKKIALQLLEERNTLLNLARKYSLLTALEVQEQVQAEKDRRDEYATKANLLKHECDRVTYEIGALQEAAEVQSYGLFDYEHPAKDSVQLNEELRTIRKRIKEAVRDKTAAKSVSGFTFNNSAAQGKKFVADMTKLMLRAYNAEAENAVKAVKSENSATALSRLNRCRDQIEKLGSMIKLEISEGYHANRVREIELAFDYYRVARLEKEIAKEAAEVLREERKVEAEIKARRDLLEREFKQKQLALKKLEEFHVTHAETMTETEKIKLELLKEEVGTIEVAIEETIQRAANLQAGYVYVISNRGAFGENVVKIGMTRRIDPMDRVKELGSASVPFTFDVHLIHYSENALKIEKELHKIFAKDRVNLMNPRKEHFYTTPAKVRDEILKLDGSITTFNEEVRAEDYFNSVRQRELIS